MLVGAHGPSPIGVDVGSRRVKLVQIRGRRRLLAAAEFDRGEPGAPLSEAEAARIDSVIRRQGFLGRQIVLGAPRASLLNSTLELPPVADGVPVDQIVAMEVARLHRRQAGTFETAWWPVGQTKAGGTRAVAVACPHATSDAWIDLMEARELDVVAIDVPSLAAIRAVRHALGSGASVILDIGWSAAVLLVVAQDSVLFERALPDGGVASLVSTLESELGLDPVVAEEVFARWGLLTTVPDALRGPMLAGAQQIIADHADLIASEIDSSISYAQQTHAGLSVDQVLLVGGGAGAPDLSERLASRLGSIPARVLAPCSRLIGDGASGSLLARPSLMTALGLADHGS